MSWCVFDPKVDSAGCKPFFQFDLIDHKNGQAGLLPVYFIEHNSGRLGLASVDLIDHKNGQSRPSF
jgi:hypothetical protein